MGDDPLYKRILLKLSGESLTGPGSFGIDPDTVNRLCLQLKRLHEDGIEIGLVIGGGNIFRGLKASQSGMDRVTADSMGMLATVINSLSLQDAIERKGVPVRVMSALAIHQVCEDFIRRRAIRHMEKGRVVVFAAGTGNPFFTTDTAASLRGTEINADIVIKATKVDGVYDSDPATNPNAVKYEHLNYDDVINNKLAVMDTTAIVLCRDNNIPIRVFNMGKQGALMNIVKGKNEGTLVDKGDVA